MKSSIITNLKHISTSGTTLLFQTRDEMIKVRLSKVAYFEADSNYCHVIFINGVKATLLASLTNIEDLLSEYFVGSNPMFIRTGKKHIVNRKYIFQINIPKQKLILSDFKTTTSFELSISKEALKELKQNSKL